MKAHPLVFAAILLAPPTACDNEPGQGKPRAAVESASAPFEKENRTSADTADYRFSNQGSKVSFVGAKVTGKHDGGFGEFEGSFTVPGGDPLKGQVAATVRTASLQADAEKLTGHLKSPDFFDVEKYPTAVFTSSAIKLGGSADATHTVTGNLELHGVTKSISFPATINVTPERAHVTAEFVINRRDFGIIYPGKPDDLIKDDVLIKLQITAAPR